MRRDEDWIKGENITLSFVLNTSDKVTNDQRKLLKKAIKKLKKNIDEIEVQIETARSVETLGADASDTSITETPSGAGEKGNKHD